jgi:GWxTD domain-containing protein
MKKKNQKIIRGKKIYKARSISLTVLFVLSAAIVFAAITAVPLHAKKSKLHPDHEEFYQYARYLFTKDERKIFKNLPDDKSREAFIKHFWEIRDPNPMTEENEFRVEIERRYEYVNKYLKEGPIPGWKTDRGRIYIMLGPPTNTYENKYGTGFAREIFWYYYDSRIFARFVDKNGNGMYYMDLSMVSLKLLDELERRKYYITNKEEKENFETAILDFKLSYDKSNQKFLIRVGTRNLSYEKDNESDLMIAKIKVNLVVYEKNNKFFSHTEVKTAKLTKEDLLKKKATVNLEIPLELPKGKLKIDAIIADFLGDAVRRKFVKVKN